MKQPVYLLSGILSLVATWMVYVTHNYSSKMNFFYAETDLSLLFGPCFLLLSIYSFYLFFKQSKE